MKTWITADSHYSHCRLAEVRGFASIEAMNKTLAENINSCVGAHDTLYHLGDFAFGGPKKVIEFRESIRCRRVHLLIGNHDVDIRKKKLLQDLFSWVKDFYELKYDGHKISLMHYPLLSWPSQEYGSSMIHGHCHTQLNHLNVGTKRFDVGVDGNDFMPYNLDVVVTQLSNVLTGVA